MRQRRATELEPTLLGDIVFADGDKIGDARLTGEKVVASGMILSFFYFEGDGEQLSAVIQKDTEIHLIYERGALIGDFPELVNELYHAGAHPRQGLQQFEIQFAGFAGSRRIDSCRQPYEKSIDKYRHPLQSEIGAGLALRIDRCIGV